MSFIFDYYNARGFKNKDKNFKKYSNLRRLAHWKNFDYCVINKYITKGAGCVYLVGQAVVYGSHGVCTVTEIEEKSVDKKMVQYNEFSYVLNIEKSDAMKLI